MPESRKTLDTMAEEIFALYQLIASLRSRQSSGQEDLSETEYVTLDALAKQEGALTIGEVQRRIGVVPAQMSRVIRALEEHGGKGYVACKINPDDRRRVDVSLTETGHDAHGKYRAARLRSMYAVLEILSPDDRIEFMRMLNLIRERIASTIDGSDA